MEYCLPHLMSKEEILRILKERQLNIPNIESLPYEELLRIYTTFAVPLVKRDVRPHCGSRSIINCQDEHNGISPKRAIKRHYALDVNLSELNLQESERAKRIKWSEYPVVAKKEMPVIISNASKKRKLITWP